MELKLELSPVFTRWQVHCQKCGAVFYVDTESTSNGEEILELEHIQCGLHPVNALLSRWHNGFIDLSKEANIIEARLGVTDCDKCRKLMKKGQPVLVIAEGKIVSSSDGMLTFWSSCVRYACHLNC